uniref:hypothetical protein n=1 Tax=Pseudomonas sp. TaxID=306 RepID=UPI00262B96B1
IRQYEEVLEGDFKDNLKLATCEMIDSIKNYETTLEMAKTSNQAYIKGIKSESVKDHSVTFNDKDMKSQLEQDFFKEQRSIMKKHLLVTRLLFRGL